MSNVGQTILFEYPLNEKIRTWLRVEFFILQLSKLHHLTDLAKALAFFRSIDELLDVLERGDVRLEILKELERQQKKLDTWSDAPGVDLKQLQQLQKQLKENSSQLHAAPRLGNELKENKLISSVRQRINIPGGYCSFDLPTFHTWMHLPQQHRDEQVNQWLSTLLPLKDSLKSLLHIIRQSGQFKPQVSINGFFQDNAEGADLLRIHLDSVLQLYPQVSGHKTRYAIRFLPLDSEHGMIPERLTFELACC